MDWLAEHLHGIEAIVVSLAAVIGAIIGLLNKVPDLRIAISNARGRRSVAEARAPKIVTPKRNVTRRDQVWTIFLLTIVLGGVWALYTGLTYHPWYNWGHGW